MTGLSIFSKLATKSKHARFSRVLFYFIIMQYALVLPIAFLLLRVQPIEVEELLPFTVIVCIGFMLMSFAFYWVMIILFGQMRKTEVYITAKERFIICVYASLLVFPIGLIVGFLIPLFHFFIFQLLVIYISYKIIKVY